MRVLTYHKVEDAVNFERQLIFLKRRKYNVLSLEEFRTKYFSASFSAKDILITFDDGEYSVYQNAMPLLKKHNMPSALFVITALIGTDRPFWWDEIMHYTGDIENVRQAKRMSNSERLTYIDGLRTRGGSPRFTQTQLTIDQLREMENSGMSIANHTATHPMLDKVTSEELRADLSASIAFLRANGFKNFDVIAYPNGNIADEVLPELGAQGFKLGFLFDHAIPVDFNTPLKISRLSVNDHTPLWKYSLIVSGIHSRYLALKKRLKK